MAETGNFPEKYAVMSPEERNSELRHFVGNPPLYALNLSKKEIGQRFLDLANELTSLLSFASVTESFRRYILMVYRKSQFFVAGTRTSRKLLEQLVGSPGTAGIFSDEDAKKLERRVYQDYLKSLLPMIGQESEMIAEAEINQILEEASWNKPLSIRPDPILNRILDQRDLVRGWREEFIMKYRDEP